MLTPREFYNLFGKTTGKVVSIPVGGSITLPFNRDRYLLCVWTNQVNIRLKFPDDDPASTLDIPLTQNVEKIFTFALHGALLMGEWKLTNAGAAPSSVGIIEGIAASRSNFTDEELSRYESELSQPRQSGDGGEQRVARPKGNPSGSSYLSPGRKRRKS